MPRRALVRRIPGPARSPREPERSASAPRRPCRGLRTLLALLLTGAAPALGSCCLFRPAPPDVQDLLDIGFRSPRQTFRTFQIAARGDYAGLEYQCLSMGFRAAQGPSGLSQLAWRELREEWYAEQPWLRLGIAQADIEGVTELSPRYRRVVASSFGTRFALTMVREDFFQLWGEERLLADEPVSALADCFELTDTADGGTLANAAAYTTAPLPDVAPTEFRVGSEWKIDSIERLDSESGARAPSETPTRP